MYKNTPAERVRQVREFHGLSQGELAKKLGVSRRSVIRFEQRGAYLSSSTYEWNGGAYQHAPSIWSLLEGAYDAACDNSGSPDQGADRRRRDLKLSHRVTGPRSRKRVTRDKSRSRTVTRKRAGRRK